MPEEKVNCREIDSALMAQCKCHDPKCCNDFEENTRKPGNCTWRRIDIEVGNWYHCSRVVFLTPEEREFKWPSKK